MNAQTAPKVSVVMPTYNHAQYIGIAIQSVMEQTFSDFELIIIDNHSDDGTEDVIRRFEDPRIRYEKFSNNGVIGASRNRGIALARGELIAFLDSDDRWYGAKLATALRAFDDHPGLVAACHAENEVRDGRVVGVIEKPAFVGDLYETLLFRRNELSPSATIVRRDVARELRGFSERPELVGVEDYDFWIRLAKTGPIALLPEILGEFRLHGNNFTANRERLAHRVLLMLASHYAAIPDAMRKEHRRGIARRKARVMAGCGVSLVRQRKMRGVPWLVRAVGAMLGYGRA